MFVKASLYHDKSALHANAMDAGNEQTMLNDHKTMSVKWIKRNLTVWIKFNEKALRNSRVRRGLLDWAQPKL